MAACADWHEIRRSPCAPLPKVGVAVLVCKDRRVLTCIRKSQTAYNQHALPGGFLEFGETLEECAIREMEEETGMGIQNVTFGAVTNTILLDDLKPSHYVTIYMKADPVNLDQEPATLKPDKCDGWTWVEWPNVPEPIFKPLAELLETNYDPFGKAQEVASLLTDLSL